MLISPTLPSIPPPVPPPSPPQPAMVEAVAKSQTDNNTGSDDPQDGEMNQQGATKNSSQPLSEEERTEAQNLAQRDREVRAHEAAHKGAAGRYARGGAEFEYERGPDGRQYAVGGEVSIDVSRPADPQAAIQKALIIRRAALAPAQPSAQDRSVAAEATNMAQEAKTEQQTEKLEADTDTDTDNPAGSDQQTRLDQAYNMDNPAQASSINIIV